uniref:Integrase catalytic domain-containing protein n=1 Tax=Fagus sylvatica TaxID=28930 RepID=A0A2N9HM89_FAGSY
MWTVPLCRHLHLIPQPLRHQTPNTSQTPDPKHLAWKATDQRLLSLLLSSLTEEAMAEAVGLSTSREVWTALENTFSHRSKAREIRLKDDLQLMKRGTRPVTAYARAFKALCDQLHAIGRPVDDTDKTHWFLRGLGSDFSSFSTAQLALTPLPCFADLVSKAESFELFQRSLEPSATTAAAFTATSRGRASNHGHFSSNRSNQQGRSNNHSSNRGRSNSGQGRRPPRCQICRTEGHYADRCHQRYARTDSSAHLAEAFNASCSLSETNPSDWYLDTGASAHMTPAQATLDQSTTYTEFTCNRFQDHLSTSGIHHQLSCPHTPAQNGRAERKHRHVTETGLALLFHSHTSPRFWVDAFSTAAYIINRLPTSLLGGKSPFELLYGSSPNYAAFHPSWLSDCCPHHFLEAQPISSLQFSNFLEPSLPPTDMPPSSPAPHSPHIPQSGSNPCDICTDPVDESLQVNDSLTGPSLPPSDPSPASLELPTELPTPAPVAATPMPSHPMLTRAFSSHA